MAIDTNLFVNIISQLKDKGFKDFQKSSKRLTAQTKLLDNSLVKLAKRAVAFETLRRSFMGFVQDDASAKRLTNTLQNLGLAFSALKVNDYLDSVEKVAGVNNDQLRPSFETIARVTGNYAKTQELLNTALDVAAGTGNDVVTVSRALARAYTGNTAGLSRLNAGLTKAQISSGNFALIMSQLNDTFAGQAQNQVNTYKGQVELLKIAFDDAGDAIGLGIVDGLKALSGEDVQAAMDIVVKGGEAIGGAFRFAGKQIAIVRELFSDLSLIQSAERDLELFEKFSKAQDPSRIRASARERRRALEIEKKTAAALAKQQAQQAAEEKKKTDAQKKLAADKLALLKASKVFDLEQIQIEAALQGEITDNEKLRLQLMKAILTENADRATTLADKLSKSQEDLTKFKREAYDFKPENPFDAWLVAIEAMRKGLASIGAPVTAIPGAPNIGGGALSVAPKMPEIMGGEGAYFITPELATSNPTGMAVNIKVEGSVYVDDFERRVVDAVVAASSTGVSTRWFRSTGRGD